MHIRFATINDTKALAFINYTSWQETYRGIIDDSFLDTLNIENLNGKWQSFFNGDPNKILLVVENENNEVIGYCCAGMARMNKNNFQSEIYALYLLKTYHHRGWGKQLFINAINELQRLGFNSCHLYVLKDNPSVNFYRLFEPGYEQLEKKKIGEKEYDEIIMGWKDFRNLKP